MLYYLGKGTEFKKEDCKEYKKLDAALKAAAKDESLVVWDETGKVIGSLTDDIPEGQSYYVKEIHVVDGKKMVRTIGDLYLSGESEHVQFEQL